LPYFKRPSPKFVKKKENFKVNFNEKFKLFQLETSKKKDVSHVKRTDTGCGRSRMRLLIKCQTCYCRAGPTKMYNKPERCASCPLDVFISMAGPLSGRLSQGPNLFNYRLQPQWTSIRPTSAAGVGMFLLFSSGGPKQLLLLRQLSGRLFQLSISGFLLPLFLFTFLLVKKAAFLTAPSITGHFRSWS
jgi:hypothetical protein